MELQQVFMQGSECKQNFMRHKKDLWHKQGRPMMLWSLAAQHKMGAPGCPPHLNTQEELQPP